jgi:hypothetical protein
MEMEMEMEMDAAAETEMEMEVVAEMAAMVTTRTIENGENGRNDEGSGR